MSTTIGENIKMYRNNSNLTQEELASKIDLSRNAIYNYENDRRTPSIKILIELAAALNIDLSDLLQGTEYKDLTNMNKEDEDIYLDFLAPDESYKKYVKIFKEFGYRVINHTGTYFYGEPKSGFIYDILDENKNPIITLDLEGFRKLGEKLAQLLLYKQTFDKSLKLLIDNEFSNFKFLYGINETEVQK